MNRIFVMLTALIFGIVAAPSVSNATFYRCTGSLSGNAGVYKCLSTDDSKDMYYSRVTCRTSSNGTFTGYAYGPTVKAGTGSTGKCAPNRVATAVTKVVIDL